MTGLMLALLNPFFSSLRAPIAKFYLNDARTDDWAVVFARLFYAVPILTVCLLIFGMPERIGDRFWTVMLVLVALEIPAQWFYHQAIKSEQLSTVLPIGSLLVLTMAPISFYAFGGWSWRAFAGILIVCSGVYALKATQTAFSLRNLTLPIQAIWTHLPSRHMLYTVLLWSATTPLQRVAVAESNIWFMGTVYLSGTALGIVLCTRLAKVPVKSVALPASMLGLAPIGILAGAANMCQYWASSLINPVFVIALKETGLLWMLVWDRLLFKTSISPLRAGSVAAVTTGNILVATSLPSRE